jgi:hypothetical protein
MMARVERARRERLHSELPSLYFPLQPPQAAALGTPHHLGKTLTVGCLD